MTTSALQTLPLVTVYDYLYDPTTGLPMPNAPVRVTFNVPLATVPPTSGGAANVSAVPKTFELVTDANGLWQCSLVPTNQINPANSTYHVSDGFENFDINPIQAGIPAGGWQASAIRTSAPATLVATGQTVSNLTDTALTQGQVVFPGVGGLLAGDPLLFWDNATKRLGVGVAAPLQPLHVVGNVRFGGAADFFWDNTNKRLGLGIAPLFPFHVKVATDVNFAIQLNAGRAALISVNDAGSVVNVLPIVGKPVQIGVGGDTYHLTSQGLAPTVGSLQTGITSQSVGGTDIRGRINMTTTGTPPAANAFLVTINFSGAYATECFVVVSGEASTGGGAAGNANFYVKDKTTGNWNLTSSAAPAASALYFIDYLVIG